MRRLIFPAAVAALMLALAGGAIAKFTQASHIRLTTQRAGHSTGIAVDVRASDATALGTKPKRATRLVVVFPAGTRFNLGTSLVRTCTLTDKQITTPFGPTCPSASQIGSGTAMVNAMPMAPQPDVDAKVKVFVNGARHVLILLFNNEKLLPGTPPIIIHATVKGSKLTLAMPHVVYGRSHTFKFAGVTAVIARLKLTIPALGSGSSALITSGTCSAHRFVVKAEFTYADRTGKVLKSPSRCS